MISGKQTQQNPYQNSFKSYSNNFNFINTVSYLKLYINGFHLCMYFFQLYYEIQVTNL